MGFFREITCAIIFSFRSIPCKYFRLGGAMCPFGSSCFYAHLGKDGRPVEPERLRTCINEEEEVKVITDAK